ncbi:MAG TPA: restriction endonuclease [Pseudonocardiaceae bacterium]|nr:restriction endonuclease [Pseudonocardiaceae bacterium]
MDIAERARELALKIRQHKANIQTEEATKNAFIMPFIGSVLGYDVFNPDEVIPEHTADIGVRKAEKIDYAIVHDGQVRILIEAKKVGEPLGFAHASQLYRYFTATSARIAILTNGETYEVYSDLDAPNLMDAKPFLVLDFSNIDETLLPELAKLAKDSFDLDSVISAAGELKYIGQLKRILAAQFRQPADEWVRFLTTRVYEGSITQKVRDQFLPLVEKASRQFLNEQVNERLKTALGQTDPSGNGTPPAATEPAEPVDPDTTLDSYEQANDLVTTEEELEGYRVVRAIVCGQVAPGRVVWRDTKTYFGVLLDDNNRKPIARLWFNRSKKYLGVFDENKVETRIPIERVEDIYRYADQLRRTVERLRRVEPRSPASDDGVARTLARLVARAPQVGSDHEHL